MAANRATLAYSAAPGTRHALYYSLWKLLFPLAELQRREVIDRLAALDKAYAFTGTANGEIAQRWYPLAVRSGYGEANEAIAEFLQRVGRRKLIMPTYAALVKTPEGLALAEKVLADARAGYHPITTGSVDAVIAKAKGEEAAAQAD